ncbi:MAG TPA: PKD domain-containing protein, partial [Iamia sp.]|nr:PKD domain-containing protein [Iamia sp.]
MPRVTAVSLLVALAATLAVISGAAPAAADTQTVTNASAHAIPAGGLAAPDHSASSVYPAPVTVSGLTGTTTKVTVKLNGLSHSNVRDVEVLLVGPGGQKMIVMSDVGGNETVTNVSPTFDDAAASAAPDTGLGSGTYKPTNLSNGFTGDLWPAPAPAAPYATTFAAFNGTNPNGVWNLYVADDASGDLGTLSGGWTLTVETGVAVFPGSIQLHQVETRGTEGGGVATVTIDRVSGADGAVGVTFTTGTGSATAGVDYTPVSTTVAFANGQTSRTVDIPIADDVSIEGIDELIPITLSAPTGGATLGSPTSGQVRLQDNDARANAFPITIPGTGPTVGDANPYPSNIVVAGASGVVTDVDVTLTNVSHTHIRDIDVLLVAPNGTTTLLMQDVGPNTPVSGLNLTFSDEAAAGITQASLTSGTYKPSQFDDELPDPFNAPAPAGPFGTTLSTMDGTSPNGTWSLYVVDDAGGDIGSINGGWSLTLTAATASAGGPYTTNEGSGVTLSGSTSPDVPGATYEWDVDGDGQYDDATGQNPTVSAGTLSSIGLGDGPDSSSVRVRATSGSAVIISTATTLTITNVAPTATFSNNGPVTLGNTADVTFTGQTDPSSADTTAGFRYSYDFDDDGDWEVGDGTYAGSSTSASATVPTSVLNAVGTFEVNGRIIDKDGGFTDYATTITVDPPPNTAPIADAGPDQEVNAGDTVTLDGTGSSDADSDELDYSWVQTAGPAVTLTGATTDSPTFTAPTGPATLTFELTVDDGTETDTDSVTITVNGIPTADAGPDQTVDQGDTVTLDGTGSSDPDSDTLTYGWVQTGGTTVTLSDDTAAQPTFTAPTGPATLTFELTVTDPGGESDTDTVVITVNAPPSASAGPDQVVAPGATVTLDGTGSSDPEAGVLDYAWVQTAGPAVTLTGADTASPTFTAPAVGVLTFELTVTDDNGATDTDTVTITVNGPPV